MIHLKIDNGGAKRDRTADLLRARQALSQLSYSPNMLGLLLDSGFIFHNVN
jgi:hypothetical protein